VSAAAALSSKEAGVGLVRFLLIWSSLSPVFLLWGMRGTTAIPDKIFAPVCVGLFVVPSLVLWFLWRRNAAIGNVRTIEIRYSQDPKDYLLTYLFAMLLPLWQGGLDSIRDVCATLFALALVLFVFWHMGLHYMNVLFAIRGYRVYTVQAGDPGGGDDNRKLLTYAVISKRSHIPAGGAPLTGYRLGGNVLVDKATHD
jgi:hypothetical protein